MYRNRGRIVSLVTIVALLGTVLFFVPQLTQASSTTARSLALKLAVRAENGTGYVRTAFKLWVDADKDGCDTRKEVLISESKMRATIGAGCKVIAGKWLSWYDGKTWTNPSDVDIDHVVPLKEAWGSGAKSWSAATREKYANDLGYPWTLDAITDNVNSSKGDKDPAQWLPPLTSARCTYAIHWVAIKYRWHLSIDTAERKKLLSILSGSCGSRTLTVPAIINTTTKTNQNTNTTITNTNMSVEIPATNTNACCKICTTGKACGDSCISKSYTCSKPPGCACDG